MSSASDAKSKFNLLKLAIVPVLLLVLGYVVWSNQASSVPTQSSDSQSDGATTQTGSGPTVLASPPAARKQKRVTWPKFTTEQILATNPFRASTEMQIALKHTEVVNAPEIAIAKEAEENMEVATEDPWSDLVENFKEKSIGVYIETSKGPAVKIGSKLFHVGDRIENRYRITEIRQDGLVVEAAPASK